MPWEWLHEFLVDWRIRDLLGFFRFPVLKTSFWGGLYRTKVSAWLAQLVSSVCMVSGRSRRRGSRKIFRGGGGSKPSTLNFDKQKKKKNNNRGEERGIFYRGNKLFHATVCLYLFISSFFNIVSQRRGSCGVGVPPLEKNWVKLVRFHTKIHNLTHKICHWGKGIFMPPDRMIGGMLFLSCLFVCFYRIKLCSDSLPPLNFK